MSKDSSRTQVSRRRTRLPDSIQSTAQILKGSNHILQSLYAQSRDLLAIEQRIRRETQSEVYVASFKNNNLALTTPKSSVATTIRYRQRSIIASLKRQGIDVNSIKIKVLPRYQPLETATRERTLSAGTSAHLGQTAAYIEDEALKNALFRLSRRSGR